VCWCRLDACAPCTLTIRAPEYLVAVAAKHTVTWLELCRTQRQQQQQQLGLGSQRSLKRRGTCSRNPALLHVSSSDAHTTKYWQLSGHASVLLSGALLLPANCQPFVGPNRGNRLLAWLPKLPAKGLKPTADLAAWVCLLH
jgi:hypothetical protein